jgi:hypothetical protein
MAVSRPSADRLFFRERFNAFDQPSFESKLLLLAPEVVGGGLAQPLLLPEPQRIAVVGPDGKHVTRSTS